MATTPIRRDNIFTPGEIDYILTLAEVQYAKNLLVANPHVTATQDFTLELSPEIRAKLVENLGEGLDISGVAEIPFRWIKGDTPAHKDNCQTEFTNTYLVYLTSTIGQLVIAGQNYPITAGTGYVFNEGLEHETQGTTSTEPRLLLGPMSNTGRPVGGSVTLSYTGGTTIYVRENAAIVEYSTDLVAWTPLTMPSFVNNTDNSGGLLIVEFITDITLPICWELFVCQSGDIQYGSRSLKNDGTRPIITIVNNNFEGLIRNGDGGTNGTSNIYVYNLVIDATGYTINAGSGWFGNSYYGKAAADNYFINCSVIGGTLPGGAFGSGGIVGAYAGSGTGGNLKIIGCYTACTLGQSDGGIVGAYAGQSGGQVYCDYCWHTGVIGNSAGGIFGDYAGTTGTAEANKCYTTGTIGQNAGGIFGRYAGYDGNAAATNCYSRGYIAAGGGGIYGLEAGTTTGNADATNCYSAGSVTTSGNGIYGTGKVGGTATNCYMANGSWTNIAANAALAPVVPLVSSPVQTIWVYRGSDTPYEIKHMGHTPYAQTIILETSPLTYLTTFSATIPKGTATAAGLISGVVVNYEILQKVGGHPGSYGTITINSTTGAISTTTATVNGFYTLYIRNTGSYNITEFELIVEDPLPCFTPGTLILTPSGYLPVETLQRGQQVITDDGRTTRIIRVHKSVAPVGPKTLPVLVPKASLGYGLPHADFTISQNHLIRVGSQGWILPKRHFALAVPLDIAVPLDLAVPLDQSAATLTYYHIELPDYTTDNLVINHGVRVESYCQSRKVPEFYAERYRRMNSATAGANQFNRRLHRRLHSIARLANTI